MTDLDTTLSVNDFTNEYDEGGSLEPKQELPTICSQCKNVFTEPVVLNCLHIFDRSCLSKFECNDNIFPVVTCPKCHMQSGSLSSLKPYITQYAIEFSLNKQEVKTVDIDKNNDYKCVLCTSDEDSKYKCIDCAGLLCERCKILHKEVKFLNNHLEVMELSQEDKADINHLKKLLSDNKPVQCDLHPERKYTKYCVQCGMLACERCLVTDHEDHSVVLLSEFPTKVRQHRLAGYIDNCRQSEMNYRSIIDRLNNALIEVSNSHDENRSHIEEVAREWKRAIDIIKMEYLKQNKDLHDELEFRIMNGINQSEKHLEHIEYAMEFTRSYLDRCSNVEFCKIIKVVLNCLTDLADKPTIDGAENDIINDVVTSIGFKEKKISSIANIIRSSFGVFLQSDHPMMGAGNEKSSSVSSMIDFSNDINNCTFIPSSQSGLVTPIVSRNNNFETTDVDHIHYKYQTSFDHLSFKQQQSNNGNTLLLHSQSSNSCNNNISCKNGNNNMIISNGSNNIFEVVVNPVAVSSISPTNVTSYSSLLSSGSIGACSHMDVINSSSAMMSDVMSFPYQAQFENRTQCDENGVMIMPIIPNTTQTSPVPTFPPIDTFIGSVSNNYMRPGSTGYNPNSRPPFPNRGNQCAAMTVKARWGSLGSGRGEMSSPHGFCLGFSEEIVVADTQNHRIQIFTKEGQFLSQFGVAGRDEGQLWFPRKVAIIRTTQRYVVCDRGNERSRMQIFGRSGHFLRKISIRYIDIVAGLAVNNMGHIVAVDSVSPSVFVVSEGGELIKWFDCSSCMREPSDIAVHGDEYFICDFKGHCVCVFKQDGTFVQRFGNETITNFPNGIDVSDHGDVLIGDSHGNRFHIAVYSNDGKLMSEFECPSVKVSRACGLKITSEGYLVTLAKNNHHVLVMDTLYIS